MASSVAACSGATSRLVLSAPTTLVYTIRAAPAAFAAATTLPCWAIRWPTSLPEISSTVSPALMTPSAGLL